MPSLPDDDDTVELLAFRLVDRHHLHAWRVVNSAKNLVLRQSQVEHLSSARVLPITRPDGSEASADTLSTVEGNIVGSSDPARGNRLSGNGGAGLLLVGSEARENEVFGNFVGLADSAGLWLAQPNGEGIVLDAGANGNKIGGAGGGEGNFVALNIDAGMRLSNNSDFNFVRRNWIGLAPNATQAGNGGDGVRIEGASNQNLVSGNVISANGGAVCRL